jgi:hypothetical protein
LYTSLQINETDNPPKFKTSRADNLSHNLVKTNLRITLLLFILSSTPRRTGLVIDDPFVEEAKKLKTIKN